MAGGLHDKDLHQNSRRGRVVVHRDKDFGSRDSALSAGICLDLRGRALLLREKSVKPNHPWPRSQPARLPDSVVHPFFYCFAELLIE
jgi:hypothetical protein